MPAKRKRHDASPASVSQGEPRPQRLQRVLASAGFGSRRQCEELITAGRVEVDGQIADQLGTQVDPEKSEIYVDGQRLKRQRLVYYLVNKPAGVLTTNRDPQGRPRVIDLIEQRERVFPVGRLDRSSEGLILLTNDGELAQQLTHPRYGVRKIYHVTVAGQVDAATLRQMEQGIYIAEGRVRVEGARIRQARPKATEMEITLREGKNREIRRILARFGHKVQRLRRVAIGPLRLGELPPGAYRPLRSEELKRLRDEARAAQRGGGAGGEDAAARSGTATAPRSKGGGGKKATRSSAGARPGAGKAAPRLAGGRRVAQQTPAKSDLPHPLRDSQRTGQVIGGEEDSAPPQRQKTQTGGSGRAAKNSGARKSAAGRGAVERGTVKKGAVKKGAVKTSGIKKGGARKAAANAAAPPRGAKKQSPAPRPPAKGGRGKAGPGRKPKRGR